MIKRLFVLLNIGLITLAAYFAVDLFYKIGVSEFLPGAADVAPEAGGVAAVDGNIAKSDSTRFRKDYSVYQGIYERDLFKTTDAAREERPAEERIEVEKLQETQLNLKLWGTVTGSQEKAYAVIEDKTKREQALYRKGDTIQGATIKMILRKKVVLRANGKDEILTMEEEKGQVGRAASTRPDAFASVEAAGENIELDRTEINSVLNNINRLMEQAKVRPYFRNGKPNGLLLTHIRQNSFFTDLGLKSGDIVRGVNGKEIKSVDDAMELYNGLKDSASVQLEIERRGETKNISYQIH